MTEPRGLTLFDVDQDALAPVHGAAPTSGLSPAPRTPAAAPPVTAPASTAPMLLAVDGDSLAHRAFHGYPADRSQGPVYGFLALLASLCDRVAVDAVVVGFDSREASVRRQRFPPYKGQRGDKASGLLALLLGMPDGLADLGVCVVTSEGWEADDVMASAAAVAESEGWRCTIATSDRDAFCLVSEDTTVLRMRGRGETVAVTPQRLWADLRVTSAQYVEYAALRGDVSDNLPGVPGIGPSRAAALLAEYPTVAAAVADPIGCRSVLGAALGQALLDDCARDASVFHRNVDLMTPRRDLHVDLEAAQRRPAANRISARLDAWGLGSLGGRLSAALAERPGAVPPPEEPL